MLIKLTSQHRMMIFAVIVMLMAFVPFVDSVPLDENGYYYTPCWVNGCWNANTGLPTCSLSFSPPKTDVNISYLVTSPIYSSPYSQYIDIENTYAGASVCSGLSPPNMVNCGSQRGFLNQSFKYNSCNRLNIAFYMKVEPSLTDSPYLAVRTKDNFTTAYSTTTNWQYVSYDLPDPISGSDFIEFRNEWISPLHYVGYIGGTYYVNMMNYYIDDVYVHCEDPYSADNWVFNGNLDLESDVGECELPPTPSSNPCDDLYLITDRGIVVLLESVLYFIINLLQCWSALWMFIFLISIGSIFVLIFKNLSRQ